MRLKSGRAEDYCHSGGDVHAWLPGVLDTNAVGVLVTVRRCTWCRREQEKPYGAGGRRPWSPHSSPWDAS